jgi:glycosyltransferase involved in cell wall biosynthesis
VKSLALIVPGSIDQLTGGYLYARRLVDGLSARRIDVAVHELAGRFPEADDPARRAAAQALAGLPAGSVAVIDGLALAAFDDCLAPEARRLSILVIVHHPLPDETGLSAEAAATLANIERHLLPLAKGVICPSARTAAAVAAYGVTRIATIIPGSMKPPRPVTRARQAGPVRLLSVATVTPRKGHTILIEALAAIAARPWRLDIIGSLSRDPATTDEVRAAIARHGLGARVSLAGEWPQARLAAAYEAADIFVLASYHEGYGMAFAEALAWGLPVLATTGGAIPEVVPQDAGILVPPGDKAALAAALARLIDDEALRARLAAGAAKAGAHLPSWDETVARWIEAADALLR